MMTFTHDSLVNFYHTLTNIQKLILTYILTSLESIYKLLYILKNDI